MKKMGTLVSLLLLLGVTLGLVMCTMWPKIRRYLTHVHQEQIALELRQWQVEFSTVRTREEALRAVDMLRYIQTYYVVGPGYRSDRATEERLERQRDSTVTTILSGLREFVGRDYGQDPNAWEAAVRGKGVTGP